MVKVLFRKFKSLGGCREVLQMSKKSFALGQNSQLKQTNFVRVWYLCVALTLHVVFEYIFHN